jgi:hypothetical protein
MTFSLGGIFLPEVQYLKHSSVQREGASSCKRPEAAGDFRVGGRGPSSSGRFVGMREVHDESM